MTTFTYVKEIASQILWQSELNNTKCQLINIGHKFPNDDLIKDKL